MTWFPETITLEFGKPQTELERARAHMRACQEDLLRARRPVAWSGADTPAGVMSMREDRFLAALSWLWDAQERELMASAIPIDVKVTIDVAVLPRFSPEEIEKVLGIEKILGL